MEEILQLTVLRNNYACSIIFTLSLVNLSTFCLSEAFLYVCPGARALTKMSIVGVCRGWRTKAFRIEEGHFMVKCQHCLFQVTSAEKDAIGLTLQRHQILCE